MPGDGMIAPTDLVTQNPEARGVSKVASVESSIGKMSPSSPMLRVLVDLPIRDEVVAHSIISAKGAPPEQGEYVFRFDPDADSPIETPSSEPWSSPLCSSSL